MANSWGHTVRPMTADEINRNRVLEERHPKYGPITCSAPKCKEPPRFVVKYRYITGRAGHASYAEKEYCVAHALTFAKKHGARMPPCHAAIPDTQNLCTRDAGHAGDCRCSAADVDARNDTPASHAA